MDRVTCADAVEWVSALPDGAADLLFTSPPYEGARTYGLPRLPTGQAWVDWMVKLVTVARPKVRGLIAINCEGQTRRYRYSCVPFLLMADLTRAGFTLRKPIAFQRFGIPGSGGKDWLRNDWEPVICVTPPGRLPFSHPKACGGPCKYRRGGAMSNRTRTGSRVRGRSAGRIGRMGSAGQPDIANPGNVIRCKVGGGHMGHPLAHENEAPFPLALAEFFVRTFCPPGGKVIDPFCGSGTTPHAAIACGREFLGCDIRRSQVDLTNRRLASVQPYLF